VDIEELVSGSQKKNRDRNKNRNILCQYLSFIVKQNISTEVEFKTANKKARRRYKITPKKSDLLSIYDEKYVEYPQYLKLRSFLIKKKMKSMSGVLVITVLTSPYPNNQKFSCKWNCYYCPAEPGQPRSYLKDEPAVARANRNGFCPKQQFLDRARVLEKNGHPIDKIELLILGGTWSSYPYSYQVDFCRDLYYSANTYWDKGTRRDAYSLQREQKINETARVKIIGLTLETRPDCIHREELRRFRMFGCTRVQLGVQHTDNTILEKINRGHTVKASIDAIRMLLNNGFKVDIHLMPDLPGSSFQKDRDMFERVLFSSDLCADQLKIYPHSVVPWTRTKKWFDDGSFVPMSQQELTNNIIWFKTNAHPWIRLNRIIRDIPNQYISGGNEITNLREVVLKILKKRGLECQCIRCREIKTHMIRTASKIVRQYRASGGEEYFISYETCRNKIIGFLRLRISRRAGLIDAHCTKYERDIPKNEYSETFAERRASDEVVFPELEHCALIRELHVYGQLQPTNICDSRRKSLSQHRGYGGKLIKHAEYIALRNGYRKMAVIAGVGTRDYYRKHGFVLRGRGAYMVKEITIWRMFYIVLYHMFSAVLYSVISVQQG